MGFPRYKNVIFCEVGTSLVISSPLSRNAVEFAIKSMELTNPSPESIVGWLLEHQDQIDLDPQHGDKNESLDHDHHGNPGSEDEEDDEDSFSDSFEDIDASGASEGVLGGGAVPPSPEVFKKRQDFNSDDEYALYIKDHIQVRHQ